MDESTSSPEPDSTEILFDDLLAALFDENKPLSPRYLYRFSDLAGKELSQFKETWPQLNSQRRRRLLEDLESLSESNSLVSFDSVCQVGLTDSDAAIRQVAIRALWECDDPGLGPAFLEILENDPEPSTQAQAAAGLGRFVYLGELGKIQQNTLNTIVDKLLEVMESDSDSRVRRNALESLGFSGHPKVPALIENAYDYGDEDWLASALVAMGRSADDQWLPMVIDKLDHSDVIVRLRATKASGELEIQDASPMLLNLLSDEDEEVQMAAVWALSEVGGDEARDTLERLIEETEDEEAFELIEEALENLYYTEELQDFSILDFSEEDLEDRANHKIDED